MQPILGGDVPKSWRKEVLYQYYDGGTPKKRGPYNMPRHEGVRGNRYKLISFYDYKDWEFYDLKNDPQELNNRYRDPGMKKHINRLKRRLSALKAQFGVPTR